MNIYIHVEIASRELDSKLLLATRAAQRGHTVILGNLATLKKLLTKGILPSGVFHTKSLTPKDAKIQFHSWLRSIGHEVTSLDEEAGIACDDYESFVSTRYAAETLESSSAVFCWGQQDYQSLVNQYPAHSERILLAGSPRCDLWKSQFRAYWPTIQRFDRPYLLVASNFGLPLARQSFSHTIRWYRDKNLLSTELEKRVYGRASENIRMIYEFVQAIRFLSDAIPDLPIVLRPHPWEDPAAWLQLLPQRPNIHVIREGPITPWIQHCLALMHNGCTSAMEAFVAGVPVITYCPFKQDYELAAANCIGTRVENSENLGSLVKAMHAGHPAPSETKKASDAVRHRLHYDEESLAADKIVGIWERLGAALPNTSPDRRAIGNFLRKRRFAKLRERFMGKSREAAGKSNHTKFPPFQETILAAQIQRLASCLNEQDVPKVKVLDERLALVTPSGGGLP